MPNEEGLKKSKTARLSRAKRRRRRRWNIRNRKVMPVGKEETHQWKDPQEECTSSVLSKEPQPVVNENMNLWIKTYKTMARRYQNQQLDYWFRKAHHLETENKFLKDKIKKLENLFEEKGIIIQPIKFGLKDSKNPNVKSEDDNEDNNELILDEYVTSSEEEEKNDEDLDPGYSEFLQKTLDHRAEVAAKKAAGLDLLNNLII